MNRHYTTNRSPLQPEAFTPLPLGAVTPCGWLRDQCRIQADGFTGHIEEFWPDLGPTNLWLSGLKREPGVGAQTQIEGWERGPYYLDGLVPLAHVLDDARLKAKATRWLESILNMQAESGWIGPVQAPNRPPYDPWPVTLVLKALTQYHEATNDPRILPTLTAFCRYLRDTLAARPLFEWSKYRWADLILSIHWLYNRTGESWLLDVAQEVARQGYDWRTHFETFRFRDKTRREDCTLETHVVNSAMAVKTGGVWWPQSGDPLDRESVFRTLERLDTYHGQVTGLFSGDEHYAGKNPSQGTELCAVVEMMFSLEVLLSSLGAPEFGDRLERIAYNALPATFTPDMWAHQYDQQVNQVLCSIAPRQWTNNNDDSNIYGLEPNFGCCTANLHQGWPKLVKSLWMATPEDGLAAVAYGPCQVTAKVGNGEVVTILEETDYPFRGQIRFTLEMERPTEFALQLRIPAWATRASVQVGSEAAQGATAGDFHRIARVWKPGDRVTLDLPLDVRLERCYNAAVSVLRGPLVFALKMGEEFRSLRGAPPLADWAVYPTTPWNYGLIVGDEAPETLFAVRESPLGPVPFAPYSAPVTLTARARRVPQWTLEQNSAGPPPSPALTQEPEEQIELIPYGSTNLRIAEFPEIIEKTN